MDIALKGFKATGLWPCDRNVIKEEDFVASVCISDPSNQELDDSTEPTMESLARATSPSILMPRTVAPQIISGVSSPTVSLPSSSIIATPPLSPRDLTPPSLSPRDLTPPPLRHRYSTPPIVQPGSSRISQNTSHGDIQQIKSHLNVLFPVPGIKTEELYRV